MVFAELFQAAGWKRDEVVVANKLWWEFWPEQTAAEELDGSLGRMRFDYVDLIYTERPPDGLAVEEVVRSAAGLIESGKARAWGVLNWQPEQIAEAARFSAAEGLPAPCAAQLPYSLVYPRFVEDEAMTEVLDAGSTSVVASAVLAGGALTGKYADADASGRLARRASQPATTEGIRGRRASQGPGRRDGHDTFEAGDRFRPSEYTRGERALRRDEPGPDCGERRCPRGLLPDGRAAPGRLRSIQTTVVD